VRWNQPAVRRLAELMPAATARVVAGGTHEAPDLAPDLVAPALEAFLPATGIA
jgi:hypothetical protein